MSIDLPKLQPLGHLCMTVLLLRNQSEPLLLLLQGKR